jgi:hypothetical protein
MKLDRWLISLTLLAVLTGCKSTPANPLLGGWTSITDLTATGAGGCPTHLSFTAQMATHTSQGQDSSVLVTYSVQPGEVFAIDQVQSVGYKFLTSDTILIDGGYNVCKYKRD